VLVSPSVEDRTTSAHYLQVNDSYTALSAGSPSLCSTSALTSYLQGSYPTRLCLITKSRGLTLAHFSAQLQPVAGLNLGVVLVSKRLQNVSKRLTKTAQDELQSRDWWKGPAKSPSVTCFSSTYNSSGYPSKFVLKSPPPRLSSASRLCTACHSVARSYARAASSSVSKYPRYSSFPWFLSCALHRSNRGLYPTPLNLVEVLTPEVLIRVVEVEGMEVEVEAVPPSPAPPLPPAEAPPAGGGATPVARASAAASACMPIVCTRREV